jgi:hypothetical protein
VEGAGSSEPLLSGTAEMEKDGQQADDPNSNQQNGPTMN